MNYTQYQVIESLHRTNLRDAVERAMEDGWQPLGGIAIFYDGDPWYYAQAMVK